MSQYIEGFLVDLDGTILENSAEIVIDFTVDFINKYSPIGKQTIKNIFMTLNKFPAPKLFYLIFNYLGMLQYLDEYLREFQTVTDYKDQKLKIRDGFHDFLEICRNEKLKCYLFSSQSKERIKNSFRNEIDIMSFDLSNISKSNIPEMHAFLYTNKIIAQNWILVDDDPFILRTGKLLGLRTILMSHNLFLNEEICEYKKYYDYTMDSFIGINNLITNANNMAQIV